MTVAQRAANAAASFFDRFRHLGPPPAPAPELRSPSADRDLSRAAAASGPLRPAPSEPRASSTARRLTIPPPGQRERRARAERRWSERRKVDLGSPYGAERRSGHDDRQADRRGRARATPPAGIGLSRDYFSNGVVAGVDARPADAASAVPDHLLIRFNSR